MLEGRERRKGEKLRLLLLDLAPGSASAGISGISCPLSGTTTLDGRERWKGEKLLLLRLEEFECRFCRVGANEDVSRSKGTWGACWARGGEGMIAYRVQA